MQRIFTMQDQFAFAALSGDYNPMHVDPVAARRLMFGRPVVHGINALIWAIDILLSQLEQAGELKAPVDIASLKTSFRSPVLVNEPNELAITPVRQSRWKLEVSSNGARLASTVLELQIGDLTANISVKDEIPERRDCRILGAGELQDVIGRLPLFLDVRSATALFPFAVRFLAEDQLAVLLASTRLVGMEVPGLHSLFTGLELKSTDAGDNALAYSVDEFDERFSMLSIGMIGPRLAGKISAAFRPAPAVQASVLVLRQTIRSDEFKGQRALIIGGSRGLGEVAVKSLVAGGADVKFTYFKGAADAWRISDEVTRAGGSAASFAYDISVDAPRIADLLSGWSPTVVYYFATPFIFAASAGRFSSELFRSFCDSYVVNFQSLFVHLEKCSPDLAGVFYPSSSALDQLPPNMVEYFTAKAAGEMLCAYLQKSHPAMHFSTPRMPRLATDQTASLLAADTTDPATYVLGLLREMQNAIHQKATQGVD